MARILPSSLCVPRPGGGVLGGRGAAADAWPSHLRAAMPGETTARGSALESGPARIIARPSFPLGRLIAELRFLWKSPVDRGREVSAEQLTQDNRGLGLVEEEGAPAGPAVHEPCSLQHKRAQLPAAAGAGSRESCSAPAGRASPGLIPKGNGRETTSLQPGEVGSQGCFRAPFLWVQGMSVLPVAQSREAAGHWVLGPPLQISGGKQLFTYKMFQHR